MVNNLLNQSRLISSYPTFQGRCKPAQSPPVPFLETQTGQFLPEYEDSFAMLGGSTPPLLKMCASSTLQNGDLCQPHSWVLASGPEEQLFVCQVVEILQCMGSNNQLRFQPDVFLVRVATNQGVVEPYEMPHLSLNPGYSLMDPRVSTSRL